MAARNYDHADFARVFASGLRETEAVLADLVGMDRLHEFDSGAVKAVFDEALGWNQYAQYLMGELCMRGGIARWRRCGSCLPGWPDMALIGISRRRDRRDLEQIARHLICHEHLQQRHNIMFEQPRRDVFDHFQLALQC